MVRALRGITNAMIDGAVAGTVTLPLLPIVAQLAQSGIDSSILNARGLVEFIASYLFLTLAGAALCAPLGAGTAAVAYIRMTKVDSESRLWIEAVGAGVLTGGVLAVLFSKVGAASDNLTAAVVLTLGGGVFGPLVLVKRHFA